MRPVEGFSKESYIEEYKNGGEVPVLYANIFRKRQKPAVITSETERMMNLRYQKQMRQKESKAVPTVAGF